MSANSYLGSKQLMRIGTQSTTSQGLRRPKEGSSTTQPTIQKILEDHGLLPKA
jgi:hypothetical protein